MNRSIHLLQKATATLQEYVRKNQDHSLLKQIGSLFESQSKVKKAVTLMNKYRPLIRRLKTGTEEEKKLAAQIEKVVSEYNSCLEKGKKRLRPLPDYITPTPFKYQSIEQVYRPIQNEELLLMRRVSVTNLPKHLLPKYQIGANAFEPLPGEVVVFTDSSHLIKSQQTGYPDPALLPFTIPESFLPQNFHLMKKKEEIAEGLLPKGKYNAKAKHLYALQKELGCDMEMANDYRAVSRVFDRLFNFMELGESLPEEPILTTPGSRDLFAKLLSEDPKKLRMIATYQQLFFYKLLCMKLNPQLLETEMRLYLKTLQSLFATRSGNVPEEVYEDVDFLSALF